MTPFRSSDLGPWRDRLQGQGGQGEGLCRGAAQPRPQGCRENLRPLRPGGVEAAYTHPPLVQASGSTLCCVTSSLDIVSWGEAHLLSGDPGSDLPLLDTQAHAALLRPRSLRSGWGCGTPLSPRGLSPPPTWGGSCAFKAFPHWPAREGGWSCPAGLRDSVLCWAAGGPTRAPGELGWRGLWHPDPGAVTPKHISPRGAAGRYGGGDSRAWGLPERLGARGPAPALPDVMLPGEGSELPFGVAGQGSWGWASRGVPQVGRALGSRRVGCPPSATGVGGGGGCGRLASLKRLWRKRASWN